MNTKIKLGSFLLFILSFPALSTEKVDLSSRLIRKNDLFLATQKVKDFLYDQDVKKRLDRWTIENQSVGFEQEGTYNYECRYYLSRYFPADNILDPLCYVLRQNDPSIRKRYKDIVRRFLLEARTAVMEIEEDPRYAQLELQTGRPYRSRARSLAKNLAYENIDHIVGCFQGALNVVYDQLDEAGNLTNPYVLPFKGIKDCLSKYEVLAGQKFLPINLEEEFSYMPNPDERELVPSIKHPGHAISETGWISGNKVTYLYQNDWNLDLTDLAQRRDLLIDTYVVNFDDDEARLEYFLANSHNKVFTAPEFNFETHPVWSQKVGTFAEIKKALQNAQKTIFMDVFFFGGSMGAALAKELVRLIEADPDQDLKVFILKDTHNYFMYRKEMLPVFDFLLAYSMKHPDRLVISGSHIEGHISGLPRALQFLAREDQFFISSGLKSEFIENTTQKAGLYIGAKSDHSKVIVVDGATADPTAFVGSKNFTDSSGAICYDDVVKIEGPAAAIIQDDYYYDMFFGLKEVMSKRYPGYLDLLVEKGWSRTHSTELNEKISSVLRPFDLLNRDKHHTPRLVRSVLVNKKGDVVLATGQNNVDSTRTNVADQVLQSISVAIKNIYIEEQFLFDRNVVQALIRSKKLRPHLDIKVILEPLTDIKPKGMPNALYLDLLLGAGIQVKRKFTNGGQGISQEFHPKTLSVDGKYLIVGSANKDQTTMYGSFREEQVLIASEEVTRQHDEVFERRWFDPQETEDFPAYDFKLPSGLKGLNGGPLGPKQFVKMLRDIIAVLYETQTL